MTLGGAPQTERSVRKALPHTRTCSRLAQVVLVFILVLACSMCLPQPFWLWGPWPVGQVTAASWAGRRQVTASVVLFWLPLMGCWCCWGGKRNGAKKCSCYNDLLFSAVGCRVQLRTVTSFRYRDTDGQRRIWEAVTAQQIRFRTDQLSITSL